MFELSVRLLYELLIGVIIVLFGLMFIVMVSNKLIKYSEKFYKTNEFINIIIHLCIIVFFLMILRYIVSIFVKNKELYNALLSIAGPIIGGASIYLSLYVGKVNTV
jgi:hypothetical protein